MAPERSPKRQKTIGTDHHAPERVEPAQVPLPPDTPSADKPAASNDRGSWYSMTWPRKSAPITQIARESISSASSVASEATAIIKEKARPDPARKSSLALTLGKTVSNKSLPAGVTTTKDHALPDAAKPLRRRSTKAGPSTPAPRNADVSLSPPLPPKPAVIESSVEQAEQVKAEPEPASETLQYAPRSWIGWLARVDETSQDSKPAAETQAPKSENNVDENVPTTSVEPNPAPKVAKPIDDGSLPSDTSNRRSWLPLWNTPVDTPPNATVTPKADDLEAQVARGVEQAQKPSSKASSIETSPPPPLPHDHTKSSAWVFWSRDRKANDSVSSIDRPHVGEIAISDDPSQETPRKASINLNHDKTKSKYESKGKANLSTVTVDKNAKDEKAVTKDDKKEISKVTPVTTKAESSNAAALAIEPMESKISRPASPAPPKKVHEHLLLPTLKDTLRLPENPSILQQLSRLLYYTKEPDLKHLSLVKEPPRIKNALAIGVHGYFPSPLVRTVLGQPTGTSIKFADMAAKSIKQWTAQRGYECQVKSAALEGEGKIAERIELLWKLLLNWIDEIRKSDFVMIACHSQGVPVAIMLVAKLIQFGCLSAARVGICAMAGVNMGPFPELKSRLFSGSAGELFEFSDTTSKVSGDYLTALEEVLKYGVRITYVGSIDDQLVSLESAIFAPISHPHIFRAVSIDSKVHAPSFVSHLVGFALKLRNLGVQDHGLIRELSAPLAGSLYGGEGHSRIYEDGSIYSLAISFALETTSLVGLPLVQRPVSSGASNPYILPFAMRGILEEQVVKTDLQDEAAELLKQFDEWKPTTKTLKDVKFRLEGIRSKL